MNVRVVRVSRSRRYAISIVAAILIGACWAGDAAPAQAEPRIIGVNIHELKAIGGEAQARTILEGEKGPVTSVRVEPSAAAEEVAQVTTSTGKRFERMTCIVGNGQGRATLTWREGSPDLHPSLKAALEGHLGSGNLAVGIQTWEEATLAEVKQCAKPPYVTVVELTNEPWVLSGAYGAYAEGSFTENGELYGRICLGLLKRVKKAEEAHEMEPVTVIASGDEQYAAIAPGREGYKWLHAMFEPNGGGTELAQLLGGISFHPYGKATLNIEAGHEMVEQQKWAEQTAKMVNPFFYVTEYGVHATTNAREIALQASRTAKEFTLLKTLSWVKGIWYYQYFGEDGWYLNSFAEVPHTVKGVVEECAREEATEGKFTSPNC